MKRVTAAIAAVILLLASPALAQSGSGLQIADTATGGVTPEEMVEILLGPNSDAVVSNVMLTGDARCAGKFAGGTGILGFEKGIVLGAGRVVDAVGPNSLDNTTTAFGTPGDSDLDTLVTDTETFDACTLEFDFDCIGVENVSFTYQFTSEEYNEFANSTFNNVFGFFLNGTNIALLPDGETVVSINNVNGGNPFGTNAQNPAFFINNDCSDGPCSINIEADGLTVVLNAGGSLDGSSNHIKLGVADSGDAVLDSWVFLKGGSFQCQEIAPAPVTQLVTVSEQAEGPNTNARSGTSVAGTGDINHNPLDDFVTGAPGFEDQSMGIGPGTGAALLYFGSTVDTERNSIDVEFVGENDHDRVGIAVASNFDFNQDGTNDILVGGEQVNRSGMDVAACNDGDPCGAGIAYLIYFDPSDSVHYPNINDPNAKDRVFLSDVGGSIPGVKFTGVDLGDQFGFSVAGGQFDTNSAGPEIAIGAPSAEVDIDGDGTIECTPGIDESECDVGVVYVVFNDPSLTGTIDIGRVANGDIDEIPGIRYVGGFPGDAVGFDVAFPGDVVEPAGDDLAIGAPLFDVETDGSLDIRLEDAGAAFIPSGGDLQKGIIDVCRVGDTSSGPSTDQTPIADGARIQGDQAGEQLGFSVAAGGDNQSDGEQDLLVGAPFYDRELDASLDLREEDVGRLIATAGQLQKGIIDVCRVGDTSSGPSTDQDEPIPGAQYVGDKPGDRLGTDGAGVDDTDGDGAEDLVIGAPGFDVERNVSGTTVTDVDAGAVYVVAGSFEGANDVLISKGIIDVCRIGDDTAGRQLTGEQAGEQAGTSVGPTGDFDGDGSPDFLVGSPGKDTSNLSDNGNVGVVVDGSDLAVVQPNQPPVADAGADVVAECDGGLAGTVNLDGSNSTDPDSTPGTNDDIVTFDWYEFFGTGSQTLLKSGEQVSVVLGLGAHTITLEVTDSFGLMDTDTVTATVQDTTPPSISCPDDVVVECQSASQASVTLDPATASDTCDASTVTIQNDFNAGGANASGSYPLGTTVVTFTATDGQGIVSMCSMSVTVQDTIPPAVSATATPDSLWPPNHKLVDIHYDVTVTDQCDPNPPVVLDDLVSSEPDDAPGNDDGKTNGDIQEADLGTADFDVKLRSEREGNGPGRTYTATYLATDASGNAASATAGVFVPHDQGGGADPVDASLASTPDTLVQWAAVTNAQHYDVVRGDVANLTDDGANIILGPVVCIENQSLDTSTSGYEDGGTPPPGGAYFYVVQYYDGIDESSYGTETAGMPRVVTSGDCH